MSVLLLIFILNVLGVNSQCDWNMFGVIGITINIGNIEPRFKYINYSGYVALVVLYALWHVLYLGYTCFCAEPDKEGHPNKQYVPLTDLQSATKKEREQLIDDQVRKDFAKAINDSFIKSKLSLISQFSDLINSGIFLYYFEYYTQIDVCSYYWIISTAVFGINIIFFIIDFFHSCLCGGCLQIGAILKYDAIKYHFSLIYVIFKIYYSWEYLHNLPTFWNLTFSMAICVKSGVLTYYTYSSNFEQNIENTKRGYLEFYAGIKQTCWQKCCGKIRSTYESFLIQVIVLIPVFLLVNTITASFYLIGLSSFVSMIYIPII